MGNDQNPANPRVRSITETTSDARARPSGDERTSWSDEALMAAIAVQDEQAFSTLYDRYVDLVYSTSLRVLGDRPLAEDTTQEIFVRLWQRPETFVAARGRFLSWLLSVTRNRAVDELRSRGRRLRREAVHGEWTETRVESEPAPDDTDPLRAAQVQESQMLVRRALRDLPTEQRSALELAYFGGLTQQEIALSLHEPLGTIKTRIRLGMQKLRAALEDQR